MTPQQFNMWTKELSKDARDAVKGALCSRGMRKGLLLKHAPAHDSDAYAAWQSLIGFLAPVRSSVWGILTMSGSQRQLFDEIDEWGRQHIAFMNRNLQRPFEFNLWHYHNK